MSGCFCWHHNEGMMDRRPLCSLQWHTILVTLLPMLPPITAFQGRTNGFAQVQNFGTTWRHHLVLFEKKVVSPLRYKDTVESVLVMSKELWEGFMNTILVVQGWSFSALYTLLCLSTICRINDTNKKIHANLLHFHNVCRYRIFRGMLFELIFVFKAQSILSPGYGLITAKKPLRVTSLAKSDSPLFLPVLIIEHPRGRSWTGHAQSLQVASACTCL